jgi:uncharacterized protein (DUF427 family)
MAKAVWKDTILAESSNPVKVEGNYYFPPQDVKKEYLVKSDYRTTCPWKGEAYYYDIVVGEDKNENAAWYYPQPKEKAVHIKGHVAFWRGVSIEE